MRAFDPDNIPRLKDLTVTWAAIAHFPIIDLELGAGAGLHAIHYSQAHPDRTLVALERTVKSVRMEGRKLAHKDLTNLHVLRADAIHWIAQEVPPAAIDRCFILYPNPYPKARHRNLRWHNMPFMGFLKTRLKRSATIVTATNERFYADEAREVMTEAWGFELIEDRRILTSEKPRTHFEKKYLARNEACWNLVFRVPVSP